MILALDIGSSSARATLYDDAGAAVEGGSRQVEYHARVTADGGVEHDAQHLLEAAAACIDAVLPAARDVAAVGVSTFWHGLLGFDGAGRPATPLYMYSDTRSAGEAEALGRRLDEAAVRARTGCPLHTSYWPAKLRWLAAGPSTVRPARWGSIGELLAAEWLGRGVTSISMASATGLFDQERQDWDPEMLDAAGLDERRLFPLADLDQGLTLRAPWASRWAKLERAVWYPAIGDGAAGSVGSGCTDRTRVAINVGTSSAMRLVTDAAAGAAAVGPVALPARRPPLRRRRVPVRGGRRVRVVRRHARPRRAGRDRAGADRRLPTPSTGSRCSRSSRASAARAGARALGAPSRGCRSPPRRSTSCARRSRAWLSGSP